MTLTDRKFLVLLLYSSSLPNDTFLADWNHQEISKTFIFDVRHDTLRQNNFLISYLDSAQYTSLKKPSAEMRR